VLRLALLGAVLASLLVPATAGAVGTFTVQNGRVLFTGNADEQDKIAGFDTGSHIRFIRFGGVNIGGGAGCVISNDGQAADCDKTGVVAVELNLNGGDDVASVSADVKFPVIFNGGNGNDGLFGGGGLDTFDGGPGNDNVVARDGRVEEVNCATGNDTAITDDADNRVSCEQVEGDADGDGVRRPADCDDTKPQIRPGVADPPDDGIDQDCSGADSTNLDRDADGFGRPQDCDDANAAIRPGARERAGNGVDENCDGVIVPFPPLAGSLANEWRPERAGTRNVVLTAKGFPRGTTINMQCSGGGCAIGNVRRRVRSRNQEVRLHRFLGDRRLRPGARVVLRFTRRGHVGRVLRYRMRSGGALPDVDFMCQPPGRKVRDC
jgi:hypothetical protein